MLREEISNQLNKIQPELQELSEYIYHHPELGHEEILSSKAHVQLLEKYGFDVTIPYLGLETAFRAEYTSEKPGPTIAFLSEYDALPGIGHGCGHNLLGATDTGAGIVLAQFVETYGGKVVVLGTPAEETDGAKVTMANEGSFDNIDVAFCTHPSDQYYQSGTSMAMKAVYFEFFGQSAHAAAAPFAGRNALDACLNFFHSISTLRQQIHPTARIHGIITHGGEAANVIPEYSRAEFYVRAMELSYLEELEEKVIRCAKAGAEAAGCSVKWGYYEAGYKNLKTNQTLSNLFNEKMNAFGIQMIESRETMGSMDMGDVSQVVPAVNPYFNITQGRAISAHTEEFRECTLTESAYEAMGNTIIGLVETALDLVRYPEKLEAVKQEFKEMMGE